MIQIGIDGVPLTSLERGATCPRRALGEEINRNLFFGVACLSHDYR